MTSNNRTYREVDGKMICGTFLEALFRGGTHIGLGTPTNTYVTAPISVFEDGMIDCWGLVDLDGFKAKVRQGEIVTSIPAGTHIYLGGGVGIHLTATEVSSNLAPEDLIGQVEDEIRALRGEATSSDLCVEAYTAYRREPSEEASRLARENVELWGRQGDVLGQLKRFQEALAAYDHVRALQPVDARGWWGMSYALLRLGRYQEALMLCERAVALDAENIGGWTNLGYALLHLKRPGDALAAYERVLRRDPYNVDARAGRFQALRKLRRYREAWATLRRVARLDMSKSTTDQT